MRKDASEPGVFAKALEERLGPDKAKTILAALPIFNRGYERWYSEALVLLRQLLPQRVQDFVGCYKRSGTRKSIDASNYVIQDYLQGLRISLAGEVTVDKSAALPQFRQQLAILEASTARFDSSLYEIRQLVQADLFDSEIDSARELLKNDFFRAAGAIAGVVLERHLGQVYADHEVKMAKKHPTIGDLNETLKGAGSSILHNGAPSPISAMYAITASRKNQRCNKWRI